jgi:hypothetical protein
MLLFIDESGQDHQGAPYEILAGVAIREQDLWNLVQAIQGLEIEIFGVRLAEVGVEIKGKKLLKNKVFRHALQSAEFEDLEERRSLCAEFLRKGRREELGGNREPRSYKEFTAYGQCVLAFVRRIYDLCAAYRVKVFASVVEPTAPRLASDFLRKDYAYLFERFFYYLEDNSPTEMGIVVFDELEKAQCRILIGQMERYFASTNRGYIRSARIIPEPFFVHSDLTTAIQLADIVAYSINWGVRLNRMTKPTRSNMEEFGQYAFDLRYVGRRQDEEDGQVRPVYGITYIDDLRPRRERNPG